MAHRKTLGVYDRRYSTVLRGSTIGGREALVPWPKRIKEEARASTPSTTANSNKNKKNSNDKQSSKKNVKSTAVPYGRGIVKAVSRVSLEDRFGPNKDDVTEIIKSINGIDTSTANSSYLTTANYDDSYNAMDGSNEFDESHTATARKSSDEEVIHRTISFSNMIETNRPTSPKAPLKFTPKAIGSKVEMVRQMSSTDYNLNNTPKAVRPHTADGMRAKSNFSDLMEDVSRQRPSSSQPTPLLPIPRPDGKKSTRQEPQHVKTTASKAAFESLGGIGYVSPSEKMIEHMMDLFSGIISMGLYFCSNIASSILLQICNNA